MTTPTREEVEQRLRACARLSRYGRVHRGVDYGAAAIVARLRELADVSELCRRLVEVGAAARASRRVR